MERGTDCCLDNSVRVLLVAGANRPRRHLCAIAGLALLLAAASPAADVADGLDQFRHGRFAEAFQDWEAASNAGDARGALYIGVLYDTGLGVEQDLGKAMAWYRKAAMDGSRVGAFNVGILYDSGLGVAKDPAEAANWYAKAAGKGFGRAEYNLGMLYEYGTGVPRDRDRAIRLFRSAASHGVTAARAHLAALGVTFAGPPAPAQETAMKEFQAAQSMITSRSADGVAKAAAVFRQSAETHNPQAEYDLGYCYERGLGVPADAGQALLWYRRAVADSRDDAIRSAAQSGIDYLQKLAAREKRP